MNDGKQPAILCLEADLFFSMRLTDVIQAQGGHALLVETPAQFVKAAEEYSPVLALVDLVTPGDWAGAIMQCKQQPRGQLLPIYAFGSHVDVETLRAARKAGADHAWARSKMMEELVDLVARHIRDSSSYPAGWDESLPELARVGIEQFNHGEYFEQHESLEAAWRAEPRAIRELYQGILQVGVAFLQIERGNWAGAVKMFRRGLPRLERLPPVCQGVQVTALLQTAQVIQREIVALGSERLAEFDRQKFPKIQLEGEANP
ncbi:MAG: DUF309 domain-containing protein [Caldilineaceae bacterium]